MRTLYSTLEPMAKVHDRMTGFTFMPIDLQGFFHRGCDKSSKHVRPHSSKTAAVVRDIILSLCASPLLSPTVLHKICVSFLHHTRVLNIGPLRVSASSKAAFRWKAWWISQLPVLDLAAQAEGFRFCRKAELWPRPFGKSSSDSSRPPLPRWGCFLGGFFCLKALPLFRAVSSSNLLQQLFGACSIRYVGAFVSSFPRALGSISSPSRLFANLL